MDVQSGLLIIHKCHLLLLGRKADPGHGLDLPTQLCCTWTKILDLGTDHVPQLVCWNLCCISFIETSAETHLKGYK